MTYHEYLDKVSKFSSRLNRGFGFKLCEWNNVKFFWKSFVVYVVLLDLKVEILELYKIEIRRKKKVGDCKIFGYSYVIMVNK